jgi:PAS domain-containing protein
VERVLATLGDTLGFSCGAVWTPSPDGGELHCAAVWHRANAAPDVVALAEASSDAVVAAGQGLPGRVWAFRRPSWVTQAKAMPNEPRAAMARRAGLMTAMAFPIATADRCAAVIEFYSHGVNEPNPEVAAMFATVGGQLAQYLERRSQPAARRWIDAADAPLLAVDTAGRVLLANAAACALAGRTEEELLGTEWTDPGDGAVSWQLTPLTEAGHVVGTWATGTILTS